MRNQSPRPAGRCAAHLRTALFAAVAPFVLMVAPAAAQTTTCTGGILSGLVWFDANNNGIQDPGETGIEGVVVTTTVGEGTILTVETDGSGRYQFCDLVEPAFYEVIVTVPAGFEPSPANQGGSDGLDSDGECCIETEGEPDQVTTLVELIGANTTTDFGFWHSSVVQPGTGTPGYWKNHAEAWPVPSITVGGRTYSRDEAIGLLSEGGSDKSLTMFSSLVPAMLNVIIGNDGSCVADTIVQANSWMVSNPAGSKVKASGAAWKQGEPLHRTLDNYNNGMLCAPHRD
jgi:hypothetical protein